MNLANIPKLPFQRLTCLCLAICCALSAKWDCLPTAIATPPAVVPGYVLLRNGNVLRGNARQDGAYVQIEEASVAEIRLPQSEVLCWATTLESLYAYRVERRTPHSLTARFNDVRWCVEQGLLEIAEAELTQLQKLAPSDSRVTTTSALLRNAQQQLAAKANVTAETNTDVVGIDQAVTVSDDETVSLDDREGTDDILQVSFSSQPSNISEREVPRHLLGAYTRRIQPLLINRCGQAGCHGEASPAVWQLEYLGSASRLPGNLTRKNLQNLLQWIHSSDVDASPLLVRASQAHGGAETSPLDASDEALRQRLQEWVTAMAMSHDPQGAGHSATDSQLDPMFAASGSSEAASASAGQASPTQPTRLPRVKDPFDPAVFNRMYHSDAP